MRKARVIAISLGGALALLIAILALSRDKEPRYQGRSLSQWLRVYEKSPGPLRVYETSSGPPIYFPDTRLLQGGQLPDQAEAVNAVRQIGTNAIPWVIRWMRQERSPWKDKVRAAFQ